MGAPSHSQVGSFHGASQGTGHGASGGHR
jgi:hypothetical protein